MTPPEKHIHTEDNLFVLLNGAFLGILVSLCIVFFLFGFDAAWKKEVDCHIATHEVQVEVPDYCITPTPTVEVGE